MFNSFVGEREDQGYSFGSINVDEYRKTLETVLKLKDKYKFFAFCIAFWQNNKTLNYKDLAYLRAEFLFEKFDKIGRDKVHANEVGLKRLHALWGTEHKTTEEIDFFAWLTFSNTVVKEDVFSDDFLNFYSIYFSNLKFNDMLATVGVTRISFIVRFFALFYEKEIYKMCEQNNDFNLIGDML